MAEHKGTSGNDNIDQKQLGIPAGTNIFGEAGDDKIVVYDAVVFGGAGSNTLTSTATDGRSALAYWYAPAGINANLATGKVVNGYGGIDTVAGFDNISGSGFDDVLVGNARNNSFTGLGGSDTITGGGGYDTVVYNFAKSTEAQISYDKATDTFTIVKNFANGTRGTDILKGIDAIVFDGSGSDYKVIAPTDFTMPVKYSYAGTWTGLASGVAVIGPFHAPIRLDGKNGLVLGGWGYQGGFGGSAPVASIPALLLEQQADGSLRVATSKYMADATTQGIGSINTADFNGDGRTDIFMAAHNESPFKAVPSAVWFGNASGGFDRVAMSDEVMAHDAQVFTINGKPTVFTQTFQPGQFNPWYEFSGGKFVVTEQGDGEKWTTSGMSIAVADFDLNGSYEALLGDIDFGPGYPRSESYKWQLVIYKLEDYQNNTGAPLTTIPTYFQNKPEYANIVSLGGAGFAHTPRIKLDDFNHDGLVDFIAVQGMWAEHNPNYPSLLQFGQNKGKLVFADRTDALNPGLGVQRNEADYSLQLLDIDSSGIDTIVSGASGQITNGVSRANNFVLLNDGTGRMHVALQDEFKSLAQGAANYLYGSTEARAAGTQGYAIPIGWEGKFIPYVSSNNTLNFVYSTDKALVNVPLEYNPAVHYTTAITIDDRNSSKLMRTFAGNDIIRDINSNGPTRIDGGLGTDTAMYGGAWKDYALTRASDGTLGVTSRASQGSQVADTLVRVERLEFKDLTLQFVQGRAADYTIAKNAGQFSLGKGAVNESLAGVERVLFTDAAIAFDTSGNAGQAYRIYQAAFDRTPDKGGLGYWIHAMDAGMSLTAMASEFINSQEFKTMYGAAPSNAELVGKFYQNVLHRTPDQAGFDYWKQLLDNKQITPAQVLASFSESPENVDTLATIIGNGIQYTAFG